MSYITSGRDPRADMRGGVQGYHTDGYVGGLGSARSDYDGKANAMRSADAANPFFKTPPNILEAAIVAALGPRPAKDKAPAVDPRVAAVAAAKAASAAKLAACRAAGGVFDPTAPNGCRIGPPVDFSSQSVEGGSNTMLLVGVGVAALALFALSRR